MKKHNFYAGPSILPQPVYDQAKAAIDDFAGTGVSLLSISHRSKEFTEVMEEARLLVRELLGLDEDFEVLFLQGGASMQFFLIPLNLLRTRAAYLDTGRWAARAIEEASYVGEVSVAASSKDGGYRYIPEDYEIPSDADYFHITTNNTIYGTQMHRIPDSPVPLVADMSSDIFSRVMDFNRFGLIYAGAQKNMGPAGTVMVAVRKSLLGKTGRRLAPMTDYAVHIAKKSMFNTPPVFAVYASMLTLRWVKEQGGVAAMEERNRRKSALLYEELDRNPLFRAFVEPPYRSMMNVTFDLTEPALRERFDRMWQEADIVGLKGHRSVGGYRASLYNALPLESVQVLVDVMRELERTA
ncbi:MAG: 3-phosphoserine/phosphohydroxythreonine transaminase [Chlorobi bacterium]|nr:3-phosphoserine/phosphohydroxythreonine transaminase [Chlorobiota bacterium]